MLTETPDGRQWLTWRTAVFIQEEKPDIHRIWSSEGPRDYVGISEDETNIFLTLAGVRTTILSTRPAVKYSVF